MSKVDVERCSMYGHVKMLTVHVNAEVSEFLESEMRVIDDEHIRFAYEYALGRVEHAHGLGLETCDVIRHRFLMSFAARISSDEDHAKIAWNKLCEPFTC